MNKSSSLSWCLQGPLQRHLPGLSFQGGLVNLSSWVLKHGFACTIMGTFMWGK